jgi:hypothetical protein
MRRYEVQGNHAQKREKHGLRGPNLTFFAKGLYYNNTAQQRAVFIFLHKRS